MKRPWIERAKTYIAIHSGRNHAEFVVGKGKWGFMAGTMWYESYDWWHLEIGITVFCLFIGLKFRWRIFGNQYNRWDKEDIYI